MSYRFVDSENSWWWTDELSETCTVSWQNKFVKLVHILGFITKKFVTMPTVPMASSLTPRSPKPLRCTVTWTYKKKHTHTQLHMYIDYYVKFPFLSNFNQSRIIPTDFRRIPKYQIWRKSVQWEHSCSLWTDGQTDMTHLLATFRSLAKAPKIQKRLHTIWVLNTIYKLKIPHYI
jgi:hypothetical protein